MLLGITFRNFIYDKGVTITLTWYFDAIAGVQMQGLIGHPGSARWGYTKPDLFCVQ